MSIGLSEEHAALVANVLKFIDQNAPVASTRQTMAELLVGIRPPYWTKLVELGLHAVHLPAEVGGGGGDLLDLAVVVEACGNGLLPGPFLSTVLTSAVICRWTNRSSTEEVLARLAAGETAATALSLGTLVARQTAEGLEVSGSTEPILGAAGGDVLVLGADLDGGEVWFLVDRRRSSVDLVSATHGDLTRDIASVTARRARVENADILEGVNLARVRTLAALLFSAEATGIMRWSLRSAVQYVKVREQFGRPVGAFQAIKHKAARLFGQVEQMSATTWNAARLGEAETGEFSTAAASAAVTCVWPTPHAVLAALQMFGGIGFTWEHDIHLYWRRSISIASLLGPRHEWQILVADAALRSEPQFTLSSNDIETEFRLRVRSVLDRVTVLSDPERRAELAHEGLVSPHYPRPYGLDATPQQQLVISEEFQRAGLAQPHNGVGEWALPTLLLHGSEEQRARLIGPTLEGRLRWCQLFSEPGAGSDLASLSTRAERVDGGWKLNGQKVWTSGARDADWGVCLARTEPTAPKHRGISYFVLQMSTPGVDVRPLRQATGAAEFNEVFLTDVFVPDDGLVGSVNEGWSLVRTTLANERLSIGSGLFGDADFDVIRLARTIDLAARGPVLLAQLGALCAVRYAIAALSLRAALRPLSGFSPGDEGSVLKLLTAEHGSWAAASALEWLGPEGVSTDSAHANVFMSYLRSPALLIGGGTSEMVLNHIAERVLGLPRD